MHILGLQKTKNSEVLKYVDEDSFCNAAITDFSLCDEKFKGYIESSCYFSKFPRYIEEFGEPRQPKGVLERKFAEHFLSLELGGFDGLDKDALVIDVAASNSPFKDILTSQGYINVFRTDLNYRTNLEAHDIGCAADEMAYFADETGSLIVSHNSVEHFEGSSDIGFLNECSRILKSGGRVVWIPLVLTQYGVNHTDLSVWETKYRNAPNYPKFDSRFPVQFGSHKQRLMKFYSPKVLDSELEKFDRMDFSIVRIDTGGRGNNFALVGEKK